MTSTVYRLALASFFTSHMGFALLMGITNNQQENVTGLSVADAYRALLGTDEIHCLRSLILEAFAERMYRRS